MYKETIKYTDYNGNEREEDFHFNISKAEVIKLQHSVNGGFESYLKKIIAAQDVKAIEETFESIIKLAYGEKSLDGKRFMKSKEITEAFVQSEAYSELLMHLLTDADYASMFINKILPELPKDATKPA